MKYNKERVRILLALLLVSIFSAQAFSLINQVNTVDDGKSILKTVVVSKQSEIHMADRKVQYDQWILQCAESTTSGNEKCNLIYQINNANGQKIIKIEVLKAVGGNTLLFDLPLGFYLPAGARLIVGNFEYLMPITTCLVSGCQAKIKVSQNLNQELKREEKAIVQLLNVNQKQKINIEFSLMGFSNGSKEIK